MDDRELAARADANYARSWRALYGHAGGIGEFLEREGLVLASSGLPIIWLNLALITRPLADPTGTLKEAIAFFDGRKLPFLIRVREGVDVAAEAAAEAAEFPYSDTVPGLVLDRIPPRRSGAPSGLDIRAASTAAEIKDHSTVIAASFGFPPDISDALFSAALLDVGDAWFYVGYHDGRPVASSALIMSDGVAGVYNVGSVPDVRKRGYGEALTWHAVHEGAARGCDIASLQASEMGRPIYERMGFRLVAPYRTFVRPAQKQ